MYIRARSRRCPRRAVWVLRARHVRMHGHGGWLGHGAFTRGGHVFDAGMTCERAISTGVPGKSYDECGNGSPMRTAPLAMLDPIEPYDIREISATTHARPVAEWPCAASCDMLRTVRDMSVRRRRAISGIDTGISHRGQSRQSKAAATASARSRPRPGVSRTRAHMPAACSPPSTRAVTPIPQLRRQGGNRAMYLER